MKTFSTCSFSNIIKMMDYLCIETFVIPHYCLALPSVAVDNYRPAQVFRLCRNGTMSYKGTGFYGMVDKPDVHIANIVPPDLFITRAFVELCAQCRVKMSRDLVGGIPNLNNIGLRLAGLDFAIAASK